MAGVGRLLAAGAGRGGGGLPAGDGREEADGGLGLEGGGVGPPTNSSMSYSE